MRIIAIGILAVLLCAATTLAKNTAVDIEFFNLKPRLQDGSDARSNKLIEVSFVYKNKTDGQVSWENENIECKCELYVNGREITTKKDYLTSHTQNLYIPIHEWDFDAIKGDWGQVKCYLSPMGNKLESSDSVFLGKNSGHHKKK
ncbi:MAG: hypothetical protein JW832_17690 [Deltaproteobacteria bacterium]|nr:hypothetical protein [Deltaproteobacteria bacterium]